MCESAREAKGDQDRRFDQSQYDLLRQCKGRGETGIEEWNEWRRQSPTVDICLEGADLSGWYLRGANFVRGTESDQNSNIGVIYSGWVYLREADFKKADVRACSFGGAYLEETRWGSAKAQGADFTLARLERAQFDGSELDDCQFDDAVLKDASLAGSSLGGARFLHSDLRGCCARVAVTDGATIIWRCMVNKETDFTGVGLDGIRVDPGTKQALEYAIRRRGWQRWYDDKDEPFRRGRIILRSQTVRLLTNRALCRIVRGFWAISDYGMSTQRILVAFLLASLCFAVVYCLGAFLLPPGFVNSLLEGKEGPVPGWLVPIRAIYFSVVTMTTLGFGDMHANCRSFWGHVLLTLQVLFGYVLLGALVTRFAVLFTAGGPAGKFVEEKPVADEK